MREKGTPLIRSLSLPLPFVEPGECPRVLLPSLRTCLMVCVCVSCVCECWHRAWVAWGGFLPAAKSAGAAEPVPGDVYQGYSNEVAAEARDEVAQPSDVLCGAVQPQQQQQRPSALKASLPRNAFSWDIYERDKGETAGEGDAQGEVPDACEEGEPFVVVPGHTAVRYIPATQMRPAIKVHRDTLPLRTARRHQLETGEEQDNAERRSLC